MKVQTVLKLIFSIVLTAAACIPILVYTAAARFLDPHGFWEKFLTLGVGLYVLGSIQLIFLLIWLAALFAIWFDSD